MKTVYTDRYGLYPWVLLFVAVLMFWKAYESFLAEEGNRLGLSIGAGGVFLVLALHRLWQLRQSKRQGRDPAIIRIKDA